MESEIILQCKNGDLQKFGELYDIYVQQIYRFILFKVCDKETAEDLTSVTFLKAMDGVKNFDVNKASFKTWLYTIARNSVIDHFRQNRETVDLEDAWGVKSMTDIAKETGDKIQLEEIEKYMSGLKPEQREILLLRIWGGHSFAEIAEITGKTEASCKMMFKRVIDKLREDFVPLVILLIFIQAIK